MLTATYFTGKDDGSTYPENVLCEVRAYLRKLAECGVTDEQIQVSFSTTRGSYIREMEVLVIHPEVPPMSTVRPVDSI